MTRLDRSHAAAELEHQRREAEQREADMFRQYLERRLKRRESSVLVIGR